MKFLLPAFLTLITLLIVLFVIARLFLRRLIEKKSFENDRVVDKLPSDLGLEYEEILIDVGSRKLQAWLVVSPPINHRKSAILILHGGGETISLWIGVQEFLYHQGISSMVFDYSAYGKSTGEAKLGNLREDAVAAYKLFERVISQDTRKYVLGFSMGAAVSLEAYSGFGKSLDGLILAQPYSSIRDLAVAWGKLPKPLAFIVPDVQNSEDIVNRVDKPLLMISSRADKVAPLEQAQKVFSAASDPKELIIHQKVNHNDLWENPTDDYWLPIIQFIEKCYHLHGENRPNPA